MKQLIANQLNQMGFETSIKKFGVLISLNRKLSKLEVTTALDQEFEAELELLPVSDGRWLIVTEEI